MPKIALDKTTTIVGTGKSTYLVEGKEYKVHPTVAERLIASGKAEAGKSKAAK